MLRQRQRLRKKTPKKIKFGLKYVKKRTGNKLGKTIGKGKLGRGEVDCRGEKRTGSLLLHMVTPKHQEIRDTDQGKES